MTFYLYIIKSKAKHTYYCGVSEQPARRLAYHNSEGKGYTRQYRPWTMVFTRAFDSKKQALKAEKIVKSWKNKKAALIMLGAALLQDIEGLSVCSAF